MKRILWVVAGLLAVAMAAPVIAGPHADDVPPLIKKLDSSNAKEVADALTEICKIGSIKSAWTKDAIQPVIKHVKDKDKLVRKEATTALGSINPPAKEAVPLICENLKDEDDKVQIAAAEALATLVGPETEAEYRNQALKSLKELEDSINKDDRTKLRAVRQAAGRAGQAIKSKGK